MSIRELYLCASLLLPLGQIALTGAAQSPAHEAEGKRALTSVGDPGEEVSYVSAFQHICTAYAMPISFETLQTEIESEANWMFPFQVQQNETLGHALDRFVENTRNAFQYKLIDDVVCVFPRNMGQSVNALDTLVSLNVEKASIWEAFKEIGKQLNANRSGLRSSVRVLPESVGVGKTPPREFTEDRSISLRLENVSAREAVCKIISVAPLQLAFSYEHGPELDWLFIRVFKDGKPWSGSRITAGMNESWIAEIEEASQP